MIGQIISGTPPHTCLSSDNEPPFEFGRWKDNLRILEIEEIKTFPYVPVSHPFVERLIEAIRRELQIASCRLELVVLRRISVS